MISNPIKTDLKQNGGFLGLGLGKTDKNLQEIIDTKNGQIVAKNNQILDLKLTIKALINEIDVIKTEFVLIYNKVVEKNNSLARFKLPFESFNDKLNNKESDLNRMIENAQGLIDQIEKNQTAGSKPKSKTQKKRTSTKPKVKKTTK